MTEEREFEEFKKLISGEETSSCKSCGGELKLEKVNLEDFQGGKLYMMEKVTAYVCEDCGETWVPEAVMDEFKEMIETVKKSQKNKSQSKRRKKK